MTKKEYLEKIKEQNIDLDLMRITIGRRSTIPYSKGCYFEDGTWMLYATDERQNIVTTRVGCDDEIFSYLYVITLSLKKELQQIF